MKKNPVIRVDFSKPVIESREEVAALLEHLAKKAGFPSAENVLSMDSFKMKKSGKTERTHGSADISICQGCPKTFLSLFQRNPSFRSAQLTA